jgi:hypothetical protein
MIKNNLKILVALIFATNVMAQNIPSYVPKDGLVGWWPFNGNANDESGNGNHGKVRGALLDTDRKGKANSAYRFDGINDSIVTSFNGILGKEERTISLWVKTESNKESFPIVYGSNLNGSRINITLNYINSGISIGTSYSAINYKSNHSTSDNKWHNYCVVLTKLESPKTIDFKIFEDGKRLTIENNSINKFQSVFTQIGIPLTFGGMTTSNGYGNVFFEGALDEISFFSRALSDQEVKQLYEGCNKETATSNNFNSVVYTTNASLNLTATPAEGTFSGVAVENNSFYPSKAKLGKNQVKYTFKNSTGCADSTNFEMILVDTLGNKCSTYDTLKIKVQLTTGIKADQYTSLNVYPNPTSDVLIIEASDVAALNGYSYKMVDLQGKQVYKELVTKSKTEISLKNIGTKGVYILHVLDEQGVSIENKKIVLE